MTSIVRSLARGETEELYLLLGETLEAWVVLPARPERLRVDAFERTGDDFLIFTEPEPEVGFSEARVAARGLPLEARVRWAAARVRELARALEGLPNPHRDVAPRSVGFRGDGTAVLYPPLAAVIASRPRMGAGVLRPHGLRFMSRELVAGTNVGPASDVYQLGMMLYLLTGASSPPPDDEIQFLTAIMDGKPWPSLREAGVDVPLALDHLVARSLSHDVGTRPQDAAAFAAELAPFADESPGDRATIGQAALALARAKRPSSPTESRFELSLIVNPCKLSWDELGATADPSVRNCSQCGLSVRRVRTEAALIPLLGQSCAFLDPE